jgi:TetR/AcrR family transcriptional regulator, repressor for uid operon
MSLTSAPTGRRPAEAERHERILKAAERAFVRHGFHAATMQHVADEVGMSAGNLYRYFPSKEAIVEGLCEIDQTGRARALASFAELLARNGDIAQAMRAGLREHVVGKPPEKARLIVEIWAEAGRNPRVAAISQAIDADVINGLERLMDAAKAAGAASPKLDSRFGARFFLTFVGGIFKRIAIEADFDADAETEMAVAVMKALFAGALSPDPVAPNAEAR